MDEHAATPDGLWLTAWFAVNAPWIIAGCISVAVRFVYRWGLDSSPIRPAISEALLCGALVSTLSPVSASMGFNSDWALFLGVLIGFAGPDVIRSAVIARIKSAVNAFFRGGKDG